MHGDCIIELAKLPDNSIDFVLTDPPYNVGLKYNSINDNLPDIEYAEWCRKWLVECNRVLKDGAYIMIFSGDLKSYWLAKGINESGLIFHHYFKWIKPNCQRALSGTVFFNRVELAFLCSKGKPNIKRINRKKIYQDYIVCKNTSNKDKDAVDHNARRPIRLYSDIIEGFTNEGDTVLDMFCGSGTTLLACKQTHRSGIGIEIDKKYIDIINNRLQNTEQYLI